MAIDGRLCAALMVSFGRLESRYPLAGQNRAGPFVDHRIPNFEQRTGAVRIHPSAIEPINPA
jgi:hypothetical protein